MQTVSLIIQYRSIVSHQSSAVYEQKKRAACNLFLCVTHVIINTE